MNRRSFLKSLFAGATALAFDPEKLLWKPGAKTIFLPAAPAIAVAGPLTFDEINRVTMEIMGPAMADELFKNTPLFARLRYSAYSDL